MLVVYSKENCPQCNVVKMMLKSRNIEFQEHMIEMLDIEYFKQDYPDCRSFPLVISDKGHFEYHNISELFEG